MDELMSHVVGSLFSKVVLVPIRVASAVMPNVVWPPLERIGRHGGALGAWLAKPFLRNTTGHRLQTAMDFVDLAEGLVGIEGRWQILDDRTAVKRVHRCPHARHLGRTTEFCTRMGVELGQGLAEPLVDDPQTVQFEVLSTLSQGHECCEYRLTIGEQNR